MPSKVTWTYSEIQYVVNHKNQSIEGIAKRLNRPIRSVKALYRIIYGNHPKPAPKIVDRYLVFAGVTFRSTWEMKLAQWLTNNNIEWQYEPKRFYYERIKSGTQSYLPDFYLPNFVNPYTGQTGTWVEVKGLLRPRGKTGIRRLRIYYPNDFKRLMYVSSKSNKVTNEFFTKLGVPLFKHIEEL